MKKIIAILASIMAVSCSYLDISPDLGLSEEDVFSKLSLYKSFLYAAYSGEALHPTYWNSADLNLQFGSFPLKMDANHYRCALITMTDIADAGRQNLRTQSIKLGVCGENNAFVDDRIPIFQAMWRCIRVANMSIEKIDMLQDAPQEEIDDILAQSYFIRGWCHMILCCYFGGMPYLDHSLGADDEWDLPRDSATETYQKAAEDFKTSYEYFVKCGRVRRDPGPGQQGHLSHSMQSYPNGVSAMALRGRCLLFAASPLNNKTGNIQLWKDAAQANAEALEIAWKYEHDLVSWDDWTKNHYGVAYTNEMLWAWNFGNMKANGGNILNHQGYPWANNSSGGGVMPTQGCVDMYETIWGDPLYTEEEREEAYAAIGEGAAGPDGNLHHYYEQNPYVNRDPRFSKTIVYDGSTAWVGTSGQPINIYYNGKTWPTTKLNGKARSFGATWNSENRAVTSTGYYSGVRWDGNYTSKSYQVSDCLIRLAEVYLNYAEAVNEAYGPNGTAGGLDLTALQAVNTIRNRAQMPDVQEKFTLSTEALRPRIQNERSVELMFEGHHYFIDERRWCIAEERMRSPLMGMYIESTKANTTYPNGKKYTRTPILFQANWKDAMNYFFLPKDEANKLKNFVNNEAW